MVLSACSTAQGLGRDAGTTPEGTGRKSSTAVLSVAGFAARQTSVPPGGVGSAKDGFVHDGCLAEPFSGDGLGSTLRGTGSGLSGSLLRGGKGIPWSAGK